MDTTTTEGMINLVRECYFVTMMRHDVIDCFWAQLHWHLFVLGSIPSRTTGRTSLAAPWSVDSHGAYWGISERICRVECFVTSSGQIDARRVIPWDVLSSL
jgi:hypothetical protein